VFVEFDNRLPIYMQVIDMIKKDMVAGIAAGGETAVYKRTCGAVSYQSEYGRQDLQGDGDAEYVFYKEGTGHFCHGR
jgi:hypothetical protein